MVNDNQNNEKMWQDKVKIAQQLQNIMDEYNLRKSKLIKYTPTEKELRDAMRFYRLILDVAEEGDPNGIKLKEILDSISTVPEEQIKFTGFLNEILTRHPTGEVPHDILMDSAEKWDVLEYIVDDIIAALGIKLKR